jgi:phosphoglycolate phosphatase
MKLIIFDVDGTLIDSQEMIYEALRLTLEHYSLKVPNREKANSVIGLSVKESFKQLFPKLEEKMLQSVVTKCKETFSKIRLSQGSRNNCHLYSGVEKTLFNLSKRTDLILGIATGKPLNNLIEDLNYYKIKNYFSNLQTSDHHPSKPNPSMLRSALRQTGISSKKAIMVGDTKFDIEMAKAASIRSIGVSWGYHNPRMLKRIGPDRIIDSFDQLERVIDELLG